MYINKRFDRTEIVYPSYLICKGLMACTKPLQVALFVSRPYLYSVIFSGFCNHSSNHPPHSSTLSSHCSSNAPRSRNSASPHTNPPSLALWPFQDNHKAASVIEHRHEASNKNNICSLCTGSNKVETKREKGYPPGMHTYEEVSSPNGPREALHRLRDAKVATKHNRKNKPK